MKIVTAILLVCLCAGAQAQGHHDPLGPREVEQLRESAQNPKVRVDLLLSFARDRSLAIDRLRSATKPGINDPDRIAELLADLASLIDELDDNLSMFNKHSDDLRRPLRHVLDAEAEFQKKLAALDQNATPIQKRRFAVALADARESMETSTQSAHSMLADQIAKKGEEKNKEKLDQQDAKRADRSMAPPEPPDYTGMGGVGRTPPPH